MEKTQREACREMERDRTIVRESYGLRDKRHSEGERNMV